MDIASDGTRIVCAALRLGVSKRVVEYWEAGKHLPPAKRDAVTRESVLARLVKPKKTLA